MKKVALAIIILGVCLSVPAFSTIRHAIQAPNTPFSIDGTEFPADSLSESDLALVKKELKRLGISDGPEKRPAETRLDRQLPFPGKTRKGAKDSPVLPAGLHADHVFRSGVHAEGTVVALGTCSESTASMTGKLIRGGWKCFPVGSGSGKILIGSITRGKENQVVILEEKGKQCLLLRRTEE